MVDHAALSGAGGWSAVTPEILRQLEQRHPLYEKLHETRELYQAIWTGQLPPALQRRFLPKGRTEEDSLYQLRLQLTQWTPESQTLVRHVLNHVLRERPDRSLGDHLLLNTFLDHACPDGRGIDELMYRAASIALTFGTAFIVVDMRERPEALDAQNREDEHNAGVGMPYATVATPLEVTDWDLDEGEQLTYLKLVTHPTRLSQDGTRTHITRYTEYTREAWARTDLIEDDGKIMMRRISSEHLLGRVPVVPLMYERIEPVIGRSYIELPARVDVDLYQTESDRAYDRYDKAHPLLVIKSDDDLDNVYGKNFVVKLRPGEDAGYTSTDGRVFDAIETHIQRRQRDIYRYGHIEPPSVKNRVQSGIARVVAQEEEGQLYAGIADQLERAETEVWELAARWLTGTRRWDTNQKAFTGSVRYPDRFSVLSAEEMVSLLKELTELGAPSVVIRELKKQVWARVLGSMTPDVLNSITQATEDDDIHHTVEQRIEIAELASRLHEKNVLSDHGLAKTVGRLGIVAEAVESGEGATVGHG